MINKSSPVQIQAASVTSFAPSPTLVSSSWSQLSVGPSRVLAIKTDGTMWAWGSNKNGTLGINQSDGVLVSSPVQIGTSSWSFVTTNYDSSFAIRSDGLLFGWGSNSSNQLANSNITGYWKSITVAGTTTFAIKYDGTLWGWGDNTSYVLLGTGAASLGLQTSPILINADPVWEDIRGQNYTVIARKKDGTLWGWGYNNVGQIGDGTVIHRSSPTQISTDSFTQISVGFSVNAAIRADGALFTWGGNLYGQLATGDLLNRSSPTQVMTGKSFINVSGGTYAISFIDNYFKIYSAGYNSGGMLGLGDALSRSNPVQIVSAPTTSFIQVSLGANYNGFAIDSTNTLWAWGTNPFLTGNIYNPTKAFVGLLPNSWTSITAGNNATAGVNGGKLYTWGINTYGQLGLGDTINRSSPVQLGTDTNYTEVRDAGYPTAAQISTASILARKSDNTWIGLGGSLGYYGNLTTLNQYGSISLSSPVQLGTFPITISPTQIGTSSWTSVAAGSRHTLAIRSDSTLWGWGDNSLGQLGVVAANPNSPVLISSSSFTAIGAGLDYSLALTTDNRLLSFGDNTSGQLGTTPANDTMYSWTSVPTANRSMLGVNMAVRQDGTLWVWGDNSLGQLGLNDTTSRSSPVQLGTATDWSSVAVGKSAMYAVKTTGTLWSWGGNANGQLGLSDSINRSSPVQVGVLTDWSRIYPATTNYALAIKSDGTLWGWGLGPVGLGLNNFVTGVSSPVMITTTKNFIKASGGDSHAVALDSTNVAYTWGVNNAGQLGIGTLGNNFIPTPIPNPTNLSNIKTWSDIHATASQTYFITTDNYMYGTGINTAYTDMLGVETVTALYSTPQLIHTNTKMRAIVGGLNVASSIGSQYAALGMDNKIYAWNTNYGAFDTANPPYRFNFTSLSAGEKHTEYVFQQGFLYGHGKGNFGQLGDNTTNDRYTNAGATQAALPGGYSSALWLSAAAGRSASVAISTDYKLYAWGAPSSIQGVTTLGQLGRSSPAQIVNISGVSFVSVSAKMSHAMALTSAGTVYSWGDNLYNQLNIPNFSWSQISVGGNNGIALRSDGYIFVWGAGDKGAIGETDGNQYRYSYSQLGSRKYIYVNANENSSMFAVSDDYKLWAWGQNTKGMLGLGDTINRSSPVQVGATLGSWASVSSGMSTTIAIQTNGTMWGWGDNFYGALGATQYPSMSSPVQIQTMRSWSFVKVSDNSTGTAPFTLALDTNKLLYSWGSNNKNQLGIMPSYTWSKIALSGDYNMGIKNDGSLWVWGTYPNFYDGTNRSSPVQLSGIARNKSFTSIGVGNYYGLALATDGTLIKINGASTSPYSMAPSWKVMSAGNSTAAAISADGKLYVWGLNNNYQLGDLTPTNSTSPKQVGTGNSWTSVSVGKSGDYMVAIDSTYKLWAWGFNGQSQLGTSDQTLRSSPTFVSSATPNKSFVQVAAGQQTTYVLDSDGFLYAFGFNVQGQLGNNSQGSLTTNTFVQIPAMDKRFRKIASGWQFVLAIDIDYKLWSWGYNIYAQLGDGTVISRSSPVQVGTSSWSQVACGTSIGVGLDTTGAIYTWGYVGDPASPASYSPWLLGSNKLSFRQVRAEGNFTVAIGADYKLYAWGTTVPVTGNLGYSPVLIDSSQSFIQVSAKTNSGGVAPAVATVNSLGQLYMWGPNTNGQLGDNTTISKAYSQAVQVPGSWIQVVANNSVLGIKSDGTLWAWGYNLYGQVNIDKIPRSSPVQIGTDTNWASVDVDYNSIIATKTNGTLWTWGFNLYGQLGQNDIISRSSPTQVGTSSWTSVSTNSNYAMAIKADGTLWGFGYNANRNLGTFDNINRSSPTQVSGGGSWSSIGTGSVHAGGRRTNGVYYIWGFNGSGQLGDGTTTDKSSPVAIATASKPYASVLALSIGYSVSYLIAQDYTVYGWGPNSFYTIGDGTATNKSSPTQIGLPASRSNPVQISAIGSSYTQIFAGDSHFGAIGSDGKTYLWGKNDQGQLGDGTTFDRAGFVLIDSGFNSGVMALGNSITFYKNTSEWVYAVGKNDIGQLGNRTSGNLSSPVLIYPVLATNTEPTRLEGSWSSIATGMSHNLAIKADGTLWAWGYNGYGQIGNNTTTDIISPIQIGTSSWASVSAGKTHSTGITVDGRMFAWGSNTNGQLGTVVFVPPTPYTLVGKTGWKMLFQTSDNKLYGTGYAAYGILTGDSTNTVSIFTPTPWTTPGVSWTKLVSVSGQTILGINSLGRLYGWGYNVYGMIGNNETVDRSSPIQIGTSSWSQVAMHNYAAAAITTDGKLFRWGLNQYGEIGNGDLINRSSPVQVAGTMSWSQVALGYEHTLGITTDGKLYTWGYNGQLQLGTLDANSRSSPAQIGTSSWSQVFASAYNSYAIDINSRLFGWGYNQNGEAGFSGAGRNSPTLVVSPGNSSWTQISAAYDFALGIKADGSLWGMGYNTYGNLGLGDTVNRSTSPVQVGASSWTFIMAEGNGSSATGSVYGLTTTNNLFVWGSNYQGAWGNGSSGENRSSPVQMSSNGMGVNPTTQTLSSPMQIGLGASWSQVYGGPDNTLAITSTRMLYAWGLNTYGNLGVYDIIARSSPIQIGTSSWLTVAALANQTSTDTTSYGITSDYRLFAWGANIYGQLGQNDTTNRSSPVQINASGVTSFTQLPVNSGGADFRATGKPTAGAIDSNGNLWLWGKNDIGQLLNNTSINRSSPYQVTTATNMLYAPTLVMNTSFVMVDAGQEHGAAVDISGKLYTWGANDYGQLGVTGSIVFFGAQGGVIRSDGVMYVWGRNNLGRLGTGDTVDKSSAVQLASTFGTGYWLASSSGYTHTLYLSSDYTAWGSGVNTSYAYDEVSATRSSPIQIAGQRKFSMIAAGYGYSIGIDKSTGQLWGTGYNAWGNLGDNTTTNRLSWSQLDTGSWTFITSGWWNNTFGIKSNYTLWGTGANVSGQLGDNTTVGKSSWVQVPGSWSMVYTTSDSANGQSAYAIKPDGTLWTWGINDVGQLGLGDTVARSSPVQVTTPAVSWSVVQGHQTLDTRSAYVFGYTTTGTLYTWGSNTAGQLGLGDTFNRSVPTLLPGSWKAPVAGYNTDMDWPSYAPGAVLLDTSDNLYFTGFPEGNTTLANRRSSPVQLNSIGFSTATTLAMRSNPYQIGTSSWTKVAAGQFATAGITSTGSLYTWGQNTSGTLGINDTINRSSPIQIGSSSWSVISVGGGGSLATGGVMHGYTTDMNVFAWGTGTSYMVAQPGAISRSSPVQIGSSSTQVGPVPILNQSSYSQVAAGVDFSLGIKADGTLWGWGQNLYGQVAPQSPTAMTNFAVGGYSNFYVNPYGNVYAHGNNTYGQLGDGTTISRTFNSFVQVMSGSWSQIATRGYAAAGIKSDGTIWTWGNGSGGAGGQGDTISRSSPTQLGTSSWTMVKISAGQTMFAIRTDGTLWGWGSNVAFGQLAQPTGTNKSSPVQIGTDTNWVQVEAGVNFVVALKSSGLLYAWGGNDYGQLGQNDTINRSSPTQIGTSSWSMISASDIGNGGYHAVAMKADGSIWTWGNNASGQLGTNNVVNRSSPVQIGGFPYKWISIATSGNSTYAISNDNRLYAWGGNAFGQLGDSTTVNKSLPTLIGTLKWGFIRAGGDYIIGSTLDYSVIYAWGNNIAVPGSFASSPVVVSTSPIPLGINTPTQISGSYTSVSAGDGYVMAQKADGSLWGWGSNAYGKVGVVTSKVLSANVQMALEIQSFMLVNDSLYGYAAPNTYGELGNNSTTAVSNPIFLSGGWKYINSTERSAFGIKTDNTMWAWGRNVNYRLGDGTSVDRSSPVQIGAGLSFAAVTANYYNGYALSTDGKLYVWGLNQSGSALGLSNTSTPTLASANSYVSLAASRGLDTATNYCGYVIDTAGQLFAWGFNASGQLGDGSTIARSALTPIAGSWSMVDNNRGSVLGIKFDGSLWAWGANNRGQLGLGDTLNRSSPTQIGSATNWTKVAVGGSNAFALDSSGNIYQSGNFTNPVLYSRSSPTQISSGVSWVNISAGYGALGAIDNLGNVYTLGQGSAPFQVLLGTSVESLTLAQLAPNWTGPSNVIISSPTQIGTSSWSAVSAGFSHTLGITIDGRLFTWGQNLFGEIGLPFSSPAPDSMSSPVQIGASSWIQVAAGKNFSLAVPVNNQSTTNLFGWGLNSDTQLGVGDAVNRSSPVQVVAANVNSYVSYTLATAIPNVSNVSSVSLAYNFLATFNNKLLYTWGTSINGNQGVNISTSGLHFVSPRLVSTISQTNSKSPVQVAGSYSSISAGYRHAHAINTANALYGWGNYNYGTNNVIAPNKSFVIQSDTPNMYLIKGDSTLWVWGYNLYGELGVNSTTTRSSPVQVPGSWASISARASNAIGIKTDGTMWGWGQNNNYSLGLGDVVSRSSPTQIGTSSNWTQVSVGVQFAAAINSVNNLYTWGNNTYGQRGDNTIGAATTPQLIAGSWSSVATGDSHILVLASDGRLFSAGLNLTYGALGLGDLISRSSPTQIGTDLWTKVAAGWSTSAAIKADGTLWAWGIGTILPLITTTNRSSPVLVNAGPWLDVNLGISNGVAIKSNNTVWAWGTPSASQAFGSYNGTIVRNSPTLITAPVDNGNYSPILASAVSTNITNMFYLDTNKELKVLGNRSYSVSINMSGDLTNYPTTNNPTTMFQSYTSSPVLVTSGTWSKVSAGNDNSTAISSTNALYFWGTNSNYQLGNTTPSNIISSPVQIGTSAVSVGVNSINSGAIKR